MPTKDINAISYLAINAIDLRGTPLSRAVTRENAGNQNRLNRQDSGAGPGLPSMVSRNDS
jgi:hypothetical protein